MDHEVQWYSPAPFWQKHLENGSHDHLQTPALLQFERDDFMNDLQRTLGETPGALPKKQAAGEKHLGRNGTTESVEGPIPLYQPAHERYYLVVASLVCRERGLPDRAVDTASEEKAAFVLRRLVPDESGSVEVNGEPHAEYRWMNAPVTSANDARGDEAGAGSAGTNGAPKNGVAKKREWRRAVDPQAVPEAEERLSMFPQSYAPRSPVEQMKGKRRLWAGLIPVARRDTFETAPVRRTEEASSSASDGSGADGTGRRAPTPFASSDDPLRDPRKVTFDTRILGAFRQIAALLEESSSEGTAEDVRDRIVFAWYDLWEFLGTHLGAVQKSIRDGKTAEQASFPEGQEENSGNRARRKRALLRVLNTANVQEMGLGDRAADALRTVGTDENSTFVRSGRLGEVLKSSDLPRTADNQLDQSELRKAFLDDDRDGDRLLATKIDGVQGKESNTEENGGREPALKTAVNRALGPVESASSLPEDLQPPTTDPVEGGTYVVRCLYERPECPGPLQQEVSAPSSPFRMASFFDAEAPGRDINITMPGVSLKDFRDSSQSATMVFTTELSKQAGKIQEEASKGLGADTQPIDLGRLCSLSIPIITICALVLLLVIVVVLNIVFWWLPFFKICFPLPSPGGD
jgi:hypothetical protein